MLFNAILKRVCSLSCLCFLLASGVSCGSDDNETDADARLETRNVYSTGCKTEQQASYGTASSMTFPGYDESLEYTCRADGYVYISHTNALFNCCSDVIKVDVSRSGNDIAVKETETDNSCNCVCPFDVSYEIGPLLPGKYNVTLDTNGKTHTFTVEYPSGKGVVDM